MKFDELLVTLRNARNMIRNLTGADDDVANMMLAQLDHQIAIAVEGATVPALAKSLFAAMQEDAMHGQQARYVNLVEEASRGNYGTNAVILGLQGLAKAE